MQRSATSLTSPAGPRPSRSSRTGFARAHRRSASLVNRSDQRTGTSEARHVPRLARVASGKRQTACSEALYSPTASSNIAGRAFASFHCTRRTSLCATDSTHCACFASCSSRRTVRPSQAPLTHVALRASQVKGCPRHLSHESYRDGLPPRRRRSRPGPGRLSRHLLRHIPPRPLPFNHVPRLEASLPPPLVPSLSPALPLGTRPPEPQRALPPPQDARPRGPLRGVARQRARVGVVRRRGACRVLWRRGRRAGHRDGEVGSSRARGRGDGVRL